MYDHIYLSPHYDDAALSCGGTIHRQCREGEAVLVVTICAAPPDPGVVLSPFAQKFHAAMGKPADVVATRRNEDRVAMVRLGVEAVRLDVPDAVYRGPEGAWYYTNIRDLFGTMHPDEYALHGSFAKAIGMLFDDRSEPTFYAPLGVGGHVDHQHAHQAAWRLKTQGRRVLFYEDYPYADPTFRLPFDEDNTVTLDVTLATLKDADLTAHTMLFMEEDMHAKIESVRAYGSQVPLLFGDDAAMVTRLRAYAMQMGDPGPAERFWEPG